jgi:hypothetical protein
MAEETKPKLAPPPYRGFVLEWNSQKNVWEPMHAGRAGYSAVPTLGGYFTTPESFRRAVDIYRDRNPHLQS